MAYSEMSYAEVPQDPDEDVSFSPRKRRSPDFLNRYPLNKLNSKGLFFATAALSGFFCYLVFSFIFPSRPVFPSYHHGDTNVDVPSAGFDADNLVSHIKAAAPPLDYHELSLEQLQHMVSQTNGYYARDWSLSLGWNNMRYIIEAAHTHAKILNRVLVLPSYVYARACEYELEACAAYAPMVNKGDEVGSDEWRNLPYEKQMSFRTPIQYMLNLTKLRANHPVITVEQYLRLHNLPPEVEATNGAWQHDAYHVHASVLDEDQAHRPSLYVIENHWYDPAPSVRVNRIPSDMKSRGGWSPDLGNPALGERGHWPEVKLSAIGQHLKDKLGGQSSKHDWAWAVALLKETDAAQVYDLDTDEGVTAALQANGWEVLYTFKSVLGMEFSRYVVDQTRQAVLRTALRGWEEEYGSIKEDVIHLVGEVHINRKPGGFPFSTLAARSEFEDRVLHHIVPVDAMYELADELAVRMREKVDGRLWMGSHMRRGDFVREGWVMESDPQDHVNRVKDRLKHGREILTNLTDIHPYPLPNVVANPEQWTLAPPQPDDKFYVATDERDPKALKVISDGGAVYLDDLLSMADRRAFGWPLMITDVRAILEQTLLAHSAYFYAHAMSSVAGGIVNMRAAFGADPRTVLID